MRADGKEGATSPAPYRSNPDHTSLQPTLCLQSQLAGFKDPAMLTLHSSPLPGSARAVLLHLPGNPNHLPIMRSFLTRAQYPAPEGRTRWAKGSKWLLASRPSHAFDSLEIAAHSDILS